MTPCAIRDARIASRNLHDARRQAAIARVTDRNMLEAEVNFETAAQAYRRAMRQFRN